MAKFSSGVTMTYALCDERGSDVTTRHESQLLCAGYSKCITIHVFHSYTQTIPPSSHPHTHFIFPPLHTYTHTLFSSPSHTVQPRVLRTEHIIIGTPYTLLDWIQNERVIDPNRITMFVLDEADIMIDQQKQRDQIIRIQK